MLQFSVTQNYVVLPKLIDATGKNYLGGTCKNELFSVLLLMILNAVGLERQ